MESATVARTARKRLKQRVYGMERAMRNNQSDNMNEPYTTEELAQETAKIREAYPSLPEETCERYAKIALENKYKNETK